MKNAIFVSCLVLIVFMQNAVADRLIEMRIPFPATVSQYKVGQLYSVIRNEIVEVHAGLGMEMVTNERKSSYKMPEGYHYKESQLTYKILDMYTRVPAFIRLLAPNGALQINENAFNSYPFTQTNYTNDYMKKYFFIQVTSVYKDGPCNEPNIFRLSAEELQRREIRNISIIRNVPNNVYKAEEDPKQTKSEKLNIGPLDTNWMEIADNLMCAYKIFDINFEWFRLSQKVESLIAKGVELQMHLFFRRSFCWADDWFDMTMDEVRAYEYATKDELEIYQNSRD